MANRFLGEVSAAADGRDFTLRMDMNAMCEFEDATGESALDLFQQATDNPGAMTIPLMRHLVRATMLRHHPDATLTDAGDVLSENPQIVQALMEATAPVGLPAGKRVAGAKKTA